MRYTPKIEFKKLFFFLPIELVQVVPLLIISFIARFLKRKVDVGIGPDPLINNIFHKKALCNKGYTAETFCFSTYYITNDFDFNFAENNKLLIILSKWPFIFCIFRFKSIFLYFNGGPLYPYTFILWKLEPFLYYLAGVETVLLAYGGDIQDLVRTPNFLFRHAVSKDYPEHKHRIQKIRKKIDLWTQRSSHIIAGCDWIEYLYHWDSVLISHFCIESEKVVNNFCKSKKDKPFLILHAPNHRTIKGTQFIEKAIKNLKLKGLDIELKIIEKMSNKQVMELIQKSDLVIDQLIIGWYAMFAIEAMSLGKPVVCNLRNDFLDFYQNVGLMELKDCPIINASPGNIEEVIRSIYDSRDSLPEIGIKGRKYVEKYHSIDYIGDHFKNILISLGVHPSK